jgi:hypothetical protein
VIPLDELQERLDELRCVRSEGRLSIATKAGRTVIYRSDREIAAAIADLERQIAALTTTPVTSIRVAASKGLDTQ